MGHKMLIEVNLVIDYDIEVYVTALCIGSYDKGRTCGLIENCYAPSSELEISDIKIMTQDDNKVVALNSLSKRDYNKVYSELEESFWDSLNGKDDRF